MARLRGHVKDIHGLMRHSKASTTTDVYMQSLEPEGIWPSTRSMWSWLERAPLDPLDGIASIGVDEIHWGHGLKADNFLTVIYQIDAGCRRLLWIGKRRTEKTLRLGLQALGLAVVLGLRFAWQPDIRTDFAPSKR
jgi:hypothetical protein